MELWVCLLFLLCLAALPAGGQPVGWACNVGGLRSSELFVPDVYNGGPAPVHGINCTALGAIPAEAQLPFWLGVSTSALQDEGAPSEGGRGPSIWDDFAANDDTTANVTADFFHRYAQDIQLMRSLGLRNFRFSISWTRLFSNGTTNLNQAGVDFYNNLIDALLANCIEPHATLHSFDLPQAVQASYGGWINRKAITDFANYSQAAFTLFGDRVKDSTTFNSPDVVCSEGYGRGTIPPQRCSDRTRCKEGNSTTEPGICSRNILVAHAEAVAQFKKLVPGGRISLAANMTFFIPLRNSTEDASAASLLNTFYAARMLDPLFIGQWSPEVQAILPPEMLPRFAQNESAMLLAARPDFIGANFFQGVQAFYDNLSAPLNASYIPVTDEQVQQGGSSNPDALLPEAIRSMLDWVDRRYHHLPIIVTETGVAVPGQSKMSLNESLCDVYRVNFYRQLLGNATAAAKEDGVDLQGFFVKYMDDWAWQDGFSKRLGIIQTNFDTLRRYYRASSLWLANLFGLSQARTADEAVSEALAAAAAEGEGL